MGTGPTNGLVASAGAGSTGAMDGCRGKFAVSAGTMRTLIGGAVADDTSRIRSGRMGSNTSACMTSASASMGTSARR